MARVSDHREGPGSPRGAPGAGLRVGLLLVCALVVPARAEDPAEILRLNLDESRMLKVPGLKRISITNPRFADVTVIGDEEVKIDGLAAGHTTMYIWDKNGRRRIDLVVISRRDDLAGQITEAVNLPEVNVQVINDRAILRGFIANENERRYAVEVARVYQPLVVDLMLVRGRQAYAPDQEIKAILDLPDVKIRILYDPAQAASGTVGTRRPDGTIEAPRISAIILEGIVDDQRDKTRAEAVAQAYATRILNYLEVAQPIQVLVQAHILEVARNLATQYGFNWGTTTVSGAAGGVLGVSGSPARQLRYVENVFESVHGQATFFGKKIKETGITYPWEFENINPLDPLFVTITWLLTEGKGRLVANPKIMTQAGAQAEVTAGFQIPYPSVGPLGVPQVTFQDANISLQILPEVDRRGNIDTTLTVAVSTPDAGRAITIAGTQALAIARRTTRTRVAVKDGDHIVISGLLQEQSSKSFDRTPFFSRIPVLGNLFTAKNYRTDQSELIVVVTPSLVTGPAKYRRPPTPPGVSTPASRLATSPALAPRAASAPPRPPPGPIPGTSPFIRRRPAPIVATQFDPASARTQIHTLLEAMKTNLRAGKPAPPIQGAGVAARLPGAQPADVEPPAPAVPEKKGVPVRRSQLGGLSEADLGAAQLQSSTKFDPMLSVGQPQTVATEAHVDPGDLPPPTVEVVAPARPGEPALWPLPAPPPPSPSVGAKAKGKGKAKQASRKERRGRARAKAGQQAKVRARSQGRARGPDHQEGVAPPPGRRRQGAAAGMAARPPRGRTGAVAPPPPTWRPNDRTLKAVEEVLTQVRSKLGQEPASQGGNL